MTLLNFKVPEKKSMGGGFDGGPVGGYVPQMSYEDAERWKCKIFNEGKENSRIEIRKSFDCVQIFIIVAKDGWDLSSKNEKRNANSTLYFDTKGLNVRMSMNGSLRLTFEQFEEIGKIVEEAKEYLNGRN